MQMLAVAGCKIRRPKKQMTKPTSRISNTVPNTVNMDTLLCGLALGFFLAVFQPVSTQGTLECYTCYSVTDVSECQETITCDPSVHSCFVEEKVDSQMQITYHMGCENRTTCSLANTGSVHLVGRQLNPSVLSVTTCFKCCDANLCNLVSCKDLCQHNPCQNGATCSAHRYGNDTTCTCLPGYTGKHCETNIDECRSSPCLNGGTCVDQVGGFKCQCSLKASGDRCQNLALGSVCMQCQNVVHPFYCKNEVFCPGEECFVDEVVANGKVSYNLGCRNQQFCAFYSNLLQQGGITGRSVRDDHVITKCTQCCTKDHCNQALCSDAYPSCLDYLHHGYTTSGVYVIDLHDNSPVFPVFCDMETDGGGWIVFQRRKDGSENFYRDWDSYKNGFGNLTGEFWLGNEKLYLLTRNRRESLRVELFDGVNHKFATYSYFSVAYEHYNYRLSVSSYSGNAGDGLGETGYLSHNGMAFTTYDKDNDRNSNINCAQEAHGGWWYSNCFMSNLNGPYNLSNGLGVEWVLGHGSHPLVFTEMKMR